MSNIELPPQEEVITIVNEVAKVYLGNDAFPLPGAPPATKNEDWVGLVGIRGAFSVAVSVSCSRHTAIDLASTMLDLPSDGVTERDAQDALAEFTNVVGGNLKAIISMAAGETCKLSLPIVTSGTVYHAHEERRISLAFACGEAQLTVEVVECSAGEAGGLMEGVV
jgi:CheY-specific phosphatase CheX